MPHSVKFPQIPEEWHLGLASLMFTIRLVNEVIDSFMQFDIVLSRYLISIKIIYFYYIL